MNCTEPLQYSGDIAGRGVRISFYVQNLILVLLIGRSHEETENALWTFISTSVGLTIAALVQLGSGNGALTLLDGILGQQRAVKVAAVLQGYFAMILTIIMWAMADKMPSSSCPSIKFVFMFAITLPALGSGRIVALVFASITLLMYTTLTYIEFWALKPDVHIDPRALGNIIRGVILQ
ncbi:hypothetical protein K439DRAFT_249716 [Ramaria rubella]|nr:hypothetical protein K439DRAFT_249716 [Ramaria rubella]